ncbi:MAG: hypothetical protein CMM00_16900 [Rhodopirellula sp.]|nr:hypothetical protein [Rhodopirellula sp.]
MGWWRDRRSEDIAWDVSRFALATVNQTPTGANAHRLIVVIRYATKLRPANAQAANVVVGNQFS